MKLKAVLLSVFVLTVALQQVRAADEINEDDIEKLDVTLLSETPTKQDLETPLGTINLSDNALSTTFVNIGFFMLVTGALGLVAYLLLGLDVAKKSYSPDPYPYTGPTAYSPTGSSYSGSGSNGYPAPASPYAHEESYNVHRTLEKAASKYQ
ncbi:hypothetical protein Pmani_035837 [Petrolisthes manimaculis]|uniref:Uncharacterized protein n=1 Tax=Petrolisthes manimaculis TaxID=1843537 RepID=A0AAE1NKV6_9EUCA|nr:hypothetical protein Pmani_035837 [Petrolisthes manimaculis]